MLLHRNTLALMLVAPLVLVAGCGGSGSSSSSSAPAAHPTATTALATTHSPVNPRLNTAAQYVAFAKAVNLLPADVTGFVATRKSESSKHPKSGEGNPLNRCVGIGKPAKPDYEATSGKYAVGQRPDIQAVSSHVQIMPSAAAVQSEMAKTRKGLEDPAIRRCLAGVFSAKFNKVQHTRRGTVRTTVKDVKIAPLAVSSATRETDASAGVSIGVTLDFTLSANGRTVSVPTIAYIDLLAFSVGRAEVALATEATGQPFPSRLEAQLFSRLVSRSIAASRRS